MSSAAVAASLPQDVIAPVTAAPAPKKKSKSRKKKKAAADGAEAEPRKLTEWHLFFKDHMANNAQVKEITNNQDKMKYIASLWQAKKAAAAPAAVLAQ